MRNPLTFEIESYLGAGFVFLLTVFLVAFLFAVMRNFDAEIDMLNATQTKIRAISPIQLQLMEAWVRENNIEIPQDEGYRYLLRAYPTKPWLR